MWGMGCGYQDKTCVGLYHYVVSQVSAFIKLVLEYRCTEATVQYRCTEVKQGTGSLSSL